MPMWQLDELSPERIDDDVELGLFALAWIGDTAVGTIKFQLEDAIFWPDLPDGDAAYIHRLAVRRSHSGGGVSTPLLEWAVEEAQRAGRRFLRLDCEAARTRLRAVYERFGFRYHSDRRVGPYYVSRYEYAIVLGG